MYSIRKITMAVRDRATLLKKFNCRSYENMDSKEAYQALVNISPDPDTSCYVEETGKWGGYQLSVILTTFNRKDFVEYAIQSVLEQKTGIDYELIVVNDGSTDGTENILRKYENNPRVRIIHQENKGFSGARNIGIDVAKGIYIMFIDDDDRLKAGAIEHLMEAAIKFDADVVEGAYETVYSNGTRRSGPVHENKKVFPLGNLQGFFWGKVYKHDCFNGIRLPEGYWFEDSLNAQIMWRICKECYTISNCVYERFEHSGSITELARQNVKSLDSFYITKKLLAERKIHGLPYDQPEYEYFLRMVSLTFQRTKNLDEKISRYIFLLQCELMAQYFDGFRTETKKYKYLEKALRNNDYKTYIFRNIIGL